MECGYFHTLADYIAHLAAEFRDIGFEMVDMVVCEIEKAQIAPDPHALHLYMIVEQILARTHVVINNIEMGASEVIGDRVHE